MKAVSTIIVVVLVILIVIALIASLYMFSMGIFTQVTVPTEKTVEKETKEMLTQFRIEVVEGDKIYIRNTGLNPIYNSSIAVFIDRNKVEFQAPEKIEPNAIDAIRLLEPVVSGEHKIEINIFRVTQSFTKNFEYSVCLSSHLSDWGIRDALGGGSYWLNESGQYRENCANNQFPYDMVKISNDFITIELKCNGVYQYPYPVRIYNNIGTKRWETHFTAGSTTVWISDGLLFSQVYGAYYTKTCFFDWSSQSWKVWMKTGSIFSGNETHGMPDFNDIKFKQEFKWRYEFKRTTYPSINVTFLMTNHDPFVRVFVDMNSTDGLNHNLTIPVSPTGVKRLGINADYVNAKLTSWNQALLGTYLGFAGGSYRRGNHWARGDQGGSGIQSPLGYVGQFSINTGASAYIHDKNYDYSVTIFQGHSPQCSWSHDTTNNNYSYEFYLDNDLEETNPELIYDDGGVAFWNYAHGGSGSIAVSIEEDDTIEKIKDVDSYKATYGSGPSAYAKFYHSYSPAKDWSDQDFIALYWYGNNDGITVRLQLSPSWSQRNTDRFEWSFTDNFSGWRRFVFPLRSPDSILGSPTLDSVGAVIIHPYWPGNGPNIGDVHRIDRTVVDVGQWVKIETFIPDYLLGQPDGTGPTDYAFAKLNFWNGTDWQLGIQLYTHDSGASERRYSYAQRIYFLDGSTASEMYEDYLTGGVKRQGGSVYTTGLRNEVRNAGDHSDSNAGSITYSSYYGVKKRTGFAIKMPPDDGQDNSTYGISQAKLKLEVYYENPGETTYEFSNDTNQFYSLQNMLKPYLFLHSYQTPDNPLIITTSDRKQASVPLFITANENEAITKTGFNIDFSGEKSFFFSLGYNGQVDTQTDSDTNNVPDVFESKALEWSNENLNSVSDSTLSYYDINSWDKTGTNDNTVSLGWNTINNDFGIGSTPYIGLADISPGEGLTKIDSRTINSNKHTIYSASSSINFCG